MLWVRRAERARCQVDKARPELALSLMVVVSVAWLAVKGRGCEWRLTVNTVGVRTYMP